MGKNNGVRYFLTQNQKGEEQAHILWDGKTNSVMAQAHPAGIFITTLEPVIEVLLAKGAVEVDAEYCQGLKIEEPVPDFVGYTVRDNPKYFKFE